MKISVSKRRIDETKNSTNAERVKVLFLSMLLSLSVGCLAQDEAVAMESYIKGVPDSGQYDGVSDTVTIEKRDFDKARLESFKNDPEFEYEQPPTIAESLWDRFLMWLAELLDSIFSGAVTTNWGRLISYVLGLAVLVVVIMAILKVDAFKVFYHAQGASTIRHNVLDENIHEIDFEREIQLAIDNADYRRGIRLLFLFALKILADRQLIAWEQGKTNHDYVNEVSEESMRNWLRQLSYYFDYAWYGNFFVSKEMFERVNAVFSSRKSGLK